MIKKDQRCLTACKRKLQVSERTSIRPDQDVQKTSNVYSLRGSAVRMLWLQLFSGVKHWIPIETRRKLSVQLAGLDAHPPCDHGRTTRLAIPLGSIQLKGNRFPSGHEGLFAKRRNMLAKPQVSRLL